MNVSGVSSRRRIGSEGRATDFGVLTAVLKRPQSHITQIGLEPLKRRSQTLYVVTHASKSSLDHVVARR